MSCKIRQYVSKNKISALESAIIIFMTKQRAAIVCSPLPICLIFYFYLIPYWKLCCTFLFYLLLTEPPAFDSM